MLRCIKFNQFQIYRVTHSYFSHPFLCTLDKAIANTHIVPMALYDCDAQVFIRIASVYKVCFACGISRYTV